MVKSQLSIYLSIYHSPELQVLTVRGPLGIVWCCIVNLTLIGADVGVVCYKVQGVRRSVCIIILISTSLVSEDVRFESLWQ